MIAICHTHYSLQTGVVSPKAWATAAAERGYRALAVADVNGLYGAVEFSQAAEDCGLKPVIGVLLQLTPDTDCTVLVMSEEGYRQCCRLITHRHLMEPFCFPDAAARSGVDQLLFLSRFPSAIRTLRPVVPRENLFLLAPAASHSVCRTPTLWDTIPADILSVSIPESWFLEDADRDAFATLRTLRRLSGTRDHFSDRHPGAVLPDAAAWHADYPLTDTVRDILQRCTFSFGSRPALLPKIALPEGIDAATHLAELCRQGLTARYPRDKQTDATRRLRKELDVIVQNGFADYFLYVHEIVRFANDRSIPVGVRGSAASCLVSYLLGFTHCCPIENDLYFERFMNPGRRDCPDIDIDIADNRRDELIDFCYRRWGSDHVAMVATIQCYRSKGALRDAARALRIPQKQFDNIMADDSRSHPQLFETAGQLVGKPRHIGIHCGGLLITPCPITDMTPLARAAKGILISHYEKDQAEAIGLVKMDLLGNSALSVIDEGMQWVRDNGMEIAEPGPAYDYKVNRLFAKGDTLGVYQCESPGMRQLCRALAPANPREVASALSLIRPGPAAAGMKDAFIRRRRGLEPVTYIHPKMADFLDATYGVMLYQEDVMKVAVNLAGYTMADADLLRRAVSKSRGNGLFEKEKHRFVFQKSRDAGIPQANADRIWEAVAQFASYSYCKAHATVYARLAWLMARLKAHHPREFYAAIFNCHKSMYPLRAFVWDAMRHNIPVFPPNINSSEPRWTPVHNGVLAGLTCIRGLTRATVDRIAAQRTQTPFLGLRDLLERVPFQAGELERLILVGACRDWGERNTLIRAIQHTDKRGRQLSLFMRDNRTLPPLPVSQLMLTGIPFGAHPTELLRRDGICPARNMTRHINGNVRMMGILNAVKVMHTTATASAPRREMSFVTLEDESGVFDVVLFPDAHRRYHRLFNHVGPFVVDGRISEQWDSCSLELQHVHCLSAN